MQDGGAGGDATLAALLENRRVFLRFLERRVADRETAEDILQDAFARALATRESLRKDESVVAWFYRMLRNAVIDRYRRDDASKRALQAFAREVSQAQPTAEVHGAVCACVLQAATALKPEYEEALREVDVEGLAVKAYAGRHGMTPNNAAVRLHRARQALRTQVVASCGACATHGCLDCRCRQDGTAGAQRSQGSSRPQRP
jgi:RNA polymerase sigma factor (sigma-70 family)